jgi:hypothetical protein
VNAVPKDFRLGWTARLPSHSTLEQKVLEILPHIDFEGDRNLPNDDFLLAVEDKIYVLN